MRQRVQTNKGVPEASCKGDELEPEAQINSLWLPFVGIALYRVSKKIMQSTSEIFEGLLQTLRSQLDQVDRAVRPG
jgi:hypothetical protein